MRLTFRDWAFAAVLAVLLVVLLLSTAGNKPKPVPTDERHRPLQNALTSGVGRETVERQCPLCHGNQGKPLPTRHPPKEQCLLCHKSQG
ncbi:MAG TPA: cytochrome C [Geobacteraceae bacterium]